MSSTFHAEVSYDNNPYGIFYAGQPMSGVVEVTVTKEKRVKTIYIIVSGKAETSWNETETYRDSQGKSNTRSIRYSAQETYLHSQTYMFGPQQGSEMTLPVGKHKYHFLCSLPAQLPCSYEGTYGYVRYTTKITLERPWKFDMTTKAAFTVISPLDLNYDPKYRLPAMREGSKSFWCGCSSGPLEVSAHFPQSGYAPGQNIDITCEVSNRSRINVDYLEFKIAKISQYHSRTPTHKVRSHTMDLVSVKADRVPRGTITTVQKTLTVPVIPPSLLHNCTIIDIDYVVKVKAYIPGCHRSLRLEIPFTVGTVPLVGLPTAPPLGPAEDRTVVPQIGFVAPPSAPLVTQQPGKSDRPDAGDLPPSYEQCMFGTNSINDQNNSKHALGFQNFAPSYQVYKDK